MKKKEPWRKIKKIIPKIKAKTKSEHFKLKNNKPMFTFLTIKSKNKKRVKKNKIILKNIAKSKKVILLNKKLGDTLKLKKLNKKNTLKGEFSHKLNRDLLEKRFKYIQLKQKMF